MAGLSIVLESQKGKPSASISCTKRSPQVINKVITIKAKPTLPSSSFSKCSFLDQCFLCKRTLLPSKDIFMYKGDRGFCSEECRYKQISMDEEDEMKMMRKSTTPKTIRTNKCSLVAMKSSATSSPTSTKYK